MAEGEKTVVRNRRARHDYALEVPIEAGMVLRGWEVKSLRAGNAHLQDAFVEVKPKGLNLVGAHIAPYEMGDHATHNPTRKRRLLLKSSEIRKLAKGVQQKGFTLIPLRIYFRNGVAKVEIALARGKKRHDKRRSIAERESDRRLKRVKRDFNR